MPIARAVPLPSGCHVCGSADPIGQRPAKQVLLLLVGARPLVRQAQALLDAVVPVDVVDARLETIAIRAE